MFLVVLLFFKKNSKVQMHNLDSKAGKIIFIGYSKTSKAHRVYNKRTLIVEEFFHVAFDESDSFILCKHIVRIKI